MGRERVSFRVTFYLRRTRVTKAGLAPILSRITVNRVASEIPVKFIGTPSNGVTAYGRNGKAGACGSGKYMRE